MSCLGVHFVLSDAEVNTLKGHRNEAARLEYITDVIEETCMGTPNAAESDKSWDALHRALSDGYLSWTGGEYPMNHAVLAGEQLYSKDDYIVSLKTPDQVKDIYRAIIALDKPAFRDLYNAIPPDDYDAELSDDDFEYTWSWFQGVRELYERAAQSNQYVLFTADQ